jgi:hypothetical protein
MLVLITGFLAHAQTNGFECATPDSQTSDPIGAYSRSIDPNVLSNFEPVFFNIYFWGINDGQGNALVPLT